MALRTRSTWGTLKAKVRRILRETTASTSYWSDTLLLDLVNHAMDQRQAEMAEMHDGWTVQAYLADTVANQREYALPEGVERVRAVYLRYVSGSQVEEIQLSRDDRIGQDYYQPASGTTYRFAGPRPTYRLLDNLILIEPPDPEARTNGMRVEIDALAPAITGDSDKLALMFPLTTETLLVYDVVLMALGVESSQGNEAQEMSQPNHLIRFHRRLEQAWRDEIAVRNQSRVYGAAFDLGD